jgi:transposase
MAKTNKKDRSVYTQEFRETAIKLALVGNKSIAEVARELGLSEKRLYSWVSAWKKKNGKELPATGSSDDELRRMQRELKELRLENEILKKATAYFAKTLL